MADQAFRDSLGRGLQASFKHAEFVEVPAAKTFVQIDAPDVLADQIAEISASAPPPHGAS